MTVLDAARQWIVERRGSRTTLLFIVYVALFIDNMLLTTVGRSRRVTVVPSGG